MVRGTAPVFTRCCNLIRELCIWIHTHTQSQSQSCKPQGLQMSGTVSTKTHFWSTGKEGNQVWVQAPKSLPIAAVPFHTGLLTLCILHLRRHLDALGLSHIEKCFTSLQICYNPHPLLYPVHSHPCSSASGTLLLFSQAEVPAGALWSLVISKESSAKQMATSLTVDFGLHIWPEWSIIYLMRNLANEVEHATIVRHLNIPAVSSQAMGHQAGWVGP